MNRCSMTNSYKRGGSVLIGIKRHKFVSIRLSIPTTNIEQIFIQLKSYNNLNLIISICYIPSNSSSSVYIKHVETIDKISSSVDPNSKCIITGDYNLSNIIFSNNCDDIVLNGTRSDKADALFECYQLNGLFQYNNNFNKSGSILASVFSNISNTTVATTNDVSVPLDTYHPALIATFESINFKIKVNAFLNIDFNFILADYNLIFCELYEIN